MIRKYRIGNPIETEAVVSKIKEEEGAVPFFEISEDQRIWQAKLERDEIVYGLGEQVRGINKRGWLYISSCTDDPEHTEGKHALYAAHNFILTDGSRKRGMFFDTPGKITFDIGYSELDLIQVTFENADLDYYLIEGDTLTLVAQEFRSLTGQCYIPPRWAFGYGQSRWSYMNEKEVREVVREHRDNQIPLDSIYLDIDYMDQYQDFTINQESFPGFPDFVEEMKREEIHLVPIIDAGVKIKEGYPIYEEGRKKGFFCKKYNGEDFVAAVWPGKVHFPDFLNEDARKWFGDQYKPLVDAGIEGFWNDMNEPAIFYSQDHLKEVFEKIADYKDKNLDITTFFEFQNLIGGINNRKEDYESFYHNYHGRRLRHDKVHNLYGYFMTRAAGEAFQRFDSSKRMLMFSRASYIGMHRYGGVWTGDNQSFWSHLLLNIKMMPSLNLCGFLFSGADTGGFGSDVTADLLLRWLEFSIFTPLMRNHSAFGTRRQEVYRFKEIGDLKNIIQLRYMLLPYIYSEFMKAALNNRMYLKPLAFDYPEDSRARKIEDQLLVGESIMIAPVYEQNATGRYVYLPEDMKMIRFRSINSMDETVLQAGDHYIEIALHEVVIFIRPDTIVPVSKGGNCVSEVDFEHPEFLSYIKNKARYIYYQDDGYQTQPDYEKNTQEFILV